MTALSTSAPQRVFHLRTRRTIWIFVRRLQASIVWTLTPCLFSAAQPRRHLGSNTTKTGINGGRVQGVPANQSPFPLPTTTLATLSLRILARCSVKVGRRSPLSRTLLNSGRNLLGCKQMFRMRLPLPRRFLLLLPQWRSVKLRWQTERWRERPTNTAAHSAQRARHQP